MLECPQDEAVDMVSDADQSISESSSSTSSDIAEDDGVLDGLTLNHFGQWEMEDDGTAVILYPDYMLYQDRYCTDSVVAFSSSSIEMKGSTAYGDQETFKIQWEIDDIIKIESQWCKRMEVAMVKISVLSKDAVQAEGATLGIEKLKFVIDSDWYEKLAAVTSLSVKYKALWSSMLDTEMDKSRWEAELGQAIPKYLPNFDDHFEDVIYPKGDADAVSISKRDVDLLRPEVFVNDTIIDFYIKYLKNKIQPEEKHRFHFFNSFFFRKLADPDKDSFSASEGRAAFQRVRKWTRKVNLFEKDYVIIPVNFNYHWSLIVMCHLGEVATFEDEDVKKSIRVPCILHMDSIKGNHAGLQDLVRSYLCEEWKEKQKEASKDISSRFYNLRFVSLELPQQQNSFDCGLFLLHYVELFLEQAPINFNPFKITKSSNFLNADWFQPAEASLKRVVIQRLIYNLLENHSQETTPAAGNDEQYSYSCQKTTFNEGCAVEFLSEKCSPSKACHRNVLSSQTDQGIKISLLPSTSLKGSECASDPGLAFTGLFEQELFLDSQYSRFTQTAPFNEFKSSMTPIEEGVETSEHFVYSPSTETGLHELTGIVPEVSSFPCSSQDFRTNTSWDAGISGHRAGDDDIESSPKASISACDDSADEVNENDGEVDADLGFKENPGQPSSPLSEILTKPIEMPNGNAGVDYHTSSLENLPGSSSQNSDMQQNGSVGLEDSLGLELDVQHATKKRRLTPPLDGEEGGLTSSLSKDLHL